MQVRRLDPTVDLGQCCNETHEGTLVQTSWVIEIDHNGWQVSRILLCDQHASALAEKLIEVVAAEEGGAL